MIVVKLMGGLGNQLFQYAVGRALSISRNVEFRYHFDDPYKLASRKMTIDKFKVAGQLLSEAEAKNYLPMRKVKRRIFSFLGQNVDGKSYHERRYYSFDNTVFHRDDVYLVGFWQSYRYFKKEEAVIREDLVLKYPSAAYRDACALVRSKSKTTSVHIRRSDYTNAKSNFSSLSVGYYRNAAEKMRSLKGETTFVIFSDDTAWVKANLDLPQDTIFAEDLRLPDYEELLLMSSCSGHIIANSSFSWWGAWLNPDVAKVVIAPREWHPAHTSESELIPPDWILL